MNCQVCNQDPWSKHNSDGKSVNGMTFCDECYEGIQAIAATMNRGAPPVPKAQAHRSSGGVVGDSWFTMLPVSLLSYDELDLVVRQRFADAIMAGWQPLALVYEDEVDSNLDRTLVGNDQFNNPQFNETYSYAVGRTARFLMGRTNADAKLHNRLETQLERVRILECEHLEQEKKIDGIIKEKVRAVESHGRERDRANDISVKEQAERGLRYKLEEHVSVLRKAVGELKAKELLGEE